MTSESAARRAGGAGIRHSDQEGTAMAAKFEVYKSGDQYRFRLKASNGEIVASGEAYKTKAGAHEGCEAVKRAAAAATIEDV
ncbi:MAG TPA: DUF1508 domain-containing protein [Jatrophihabitans sp.]